MTPRRLIVTAGLVLTLTACGEVTTVAKPLRIEFGIAGGNIVPYTVAISPTGAVSSTGHVGLSRTQLSGATTERLKIAVINALRLGQLKSRQCPGTLPDVAAQFLRAGGQTFRVHGTCEPRFTLLWNWLTRAVGLKP